MAATATNIILELSKILGWWSILKVDDAWDVFNVILNQIQSKFIPLKQRQRNVFRRPVWLTAEIKQTVMAKKTAFHKLKESQVYLRACQSFRNKVKKVIRAAKRAKEIDLARRCDKDSKTCF